MFVENKGQWHAGAYSARFGDMIVRVDRHGFDVCARTIDGRAVARFEFGSAAVLAARGPCGARRNYLLGSDPARWATAVTAYRAIDVVTDRYSIRLTPTTMGLRVTALQAGPTGTSKLAALSLRGASLRQEGDRAFVVVDEHHLVAVDAEWGDGALAEVSEEDQLVLLYADGAAVSLSMAAVLGGQSDDVFLDVAHHPTHGAYSAGWSESMDFPTTLGVIQPTAPRVSPPFGSLDAVVVRTSPQGDVVFATYLGGEFGDEASAIVVDEHGRAVVVGRTGSPDFPVTPGAFDETNSLFDVFVTRLTADGSDIEASTFIGGESTDDPFDAALDGEGRVLIGGSTSSSDFPIVGGVDSTGPQLGTDGFVVLFQHDLTSVVFSTFLGGDGADTVRAVVCSGEQTVVAGVTGAPDFPVTAGAFDTSFQPGGFVTALAPDGSTIRASTFLGGSSGETLTDLAVRCDGAIVIGGFTASNDYPVTPGTIQPFPIIGLGPDAVLTCFDPSLSSLVYSTYFGGFGSIEINELHVDPSGVVTVAGSTNTAALPVTPGAFDTEHGAFSYDAFVSRFDPTASRLLYSTYLGGSDDEASPGNRPGLAVDDEGNAYLATFTLSDDFPTTSTSGPLGDADATLTQLTMLPAGVQRHGTWTSSAGPITKGVANMPSPGAEAFYLTSSGAPAFAQGFTVVALEAVDRPAQGVGVELWFEPTSLVTLLPIAADHVGYAELHLRVPTDPAFLGLSHVVQDVWFADGAWSASNALVVTVSDVP